MTRILLVALMAGLVAAARADDARPGYVVHASVPLVPQFDGVSGRLELLEDERIRPGIRRELWGSSADVHCAESSSAFCADLKQQPLRPALLRLVGDDGRELMVDAQKRELGELRVLHLRGDGGRPTYAVTIDFGEGMGSYNGPVTRFAELRQGRLTWLRAVDARGEHPKEVSLLASLKSAWEVVPSRAGTRDILAVDCRPDLRQARKGAVELPFVTTLSRYSFRGDRWRRYSRSEPGIWEHDGPFPARQRFP